MKTKSTLIAVALLFFFGGQVFGQNENIKKRIEGANGTTKYVQFEKPEHINNQVLLKQQLNLTDNDEFRLTQSTEDELGLVHEKFQQYHRNIKVEFATYTVHRDRSGGVTAISGQQLNLRDISLNPAISKENALSNAIAAVGAKKYMWDNESQEQFLKRSSKNISASYYPKGELIIMPIINTQNEDEYMKPVLAYKFDIYAEEPVSREHIYVNAKSGEVILRNAVIKHVNGTAATKYSGSRTISTATTTGGFKLLDTSRGNGVATFDMNEGTNYNSAVNFVDSDNNWTSAEWNNTAEDNAALDAHWGAMMTYDYYLQKHNRNSYNNSGAAINSYVHFDQNFNNAYWNGSVMTYGDGDGSTFTPLTCLDVAAHEISHAVTEFTSNLVYQRESGAMNEAMSDIFGAAVENFAAPEKDTWLLAEDIMVSAAALRSMSDPKSQGQPDTYGGTNWINPNCGTPTQFNDYCGVHTNSGVLNHWFYILSVGKSGANDIGSSYSVAGIGIDKAANIAYRMQTVYLSSNSNYADARSFAIQSAVDLYGAASAEEIATTNAMYAVGVGSEYGGGSGGGCTTTISSYPYNEGFESGLGAWTQGSGDDFDWTRKSGTTPSNNTGPSSASEGSYYMYMESSTPNYSNKTSYFNSPCFDLSSQTSATFNFKYHMYGASNMGDLKLEASTDDGGSWTTVWSKNGNQGNAWQSASVNLNSYAGSTVQLRFNGITGGTWQGDMAVDDLSMTSGGGGGPTACTGGITSFPYGEGFENTLGAWSQGSGDDFNWATRSGGTPSNNTGPSSASQGSYYVYMESSNPNNPSKTAILNSPCFDLSSESAAFFTFKYHMYGAANMGSLKLQVSTDNGGSWADVWSKTGNQGNAWQSASVDLVSYTGSSIQLRYYGTTGGTWQGDMAVDDVALSSSGGGTGGCNDTNLSITFDNYPEETSWEIKDDGGSVVASGGTYGSQADGSTLVIPNCLDTGCYTLVMKDVYGDGICCSFGNGSYTLTDASGTVLASGASFTSSDTKAFCVGGASVANGLAADSGISKLEEVRAYSIYPNPADDILNVRLTKTDGHATIRIYSVSGKIVYRRDVTEAVQEIDVSKLGSGIYIIEVNDGVNVTNTKFQKK